MVQIFFIEIISVLILIYGFKIRKKYKEDLDKEKRLSNDTLIEINGIILTGIAGIIGGLIFLIKSFF